MLPCLAQCGWARALLWQLAAGPTASASPCIALCAVCPQPPFPLLTTIPCPLPAYLLPALQCKSVEDINDSLRSVVDIDGAPWEAGVLVAFLVVSRLMVYVALRKKTQR